jgi:phage FluMu protein gp41
MVDLDLDILVANPRTLTLFNEARTFRELTMEESFKVEFLQEQIKELLFEKGKKVVFTDEYKNKQIEMIQLLIEPISVEEIGQIKQKQFSALMEEVDYYDALDQGIVENRDEYNQLKEKALKEQKKLLEIEKQPEEAEDEDEPSFP